MGADFYDLSDRSQATILFSLDAAATSELEDIFFPASKRWGDVLSLGKDSRILASQVDFLISLIDQAGRRRKYSDFRDFLARCRDAGVNLKVVAD